jgi:hypothetical protein
MFCFAHDEKETLKYYLSLVKLEKERQVEMMRSLAFFFSSSFSA